MTEPSREVAQRSPAQSLVASVRSERFREQVAIALPPTVTEDRFIRVACTAILANPDIAKLDHESLLRAMIQAATDGLMPDGREAAFAPRGGKAVYTPMIGGFRKIAAEHGWTLRTAVVYSEDEFRHGVIDGVETINHFPVRPGTPRGDLVAAYAIATQADGRRMMVVLHPDDIAKRRKSASTDKVWNEHPAAMWEKSAGRDLFAQLPLPDTDLVSRVVRAGAVDATEATTALYGSRPAQLPAAVGTAPAGERQADGAAPVSSSIPDDDPAAAAADNKPEPAASTEDAALQEAADQASQLHPPNGKYEHLSLSEIHASGDTGWLLFVLRQGQHMRPAAFRDAVWAFCRVYAPELYHQALAEAEAAQS